MGRRRLRTAIAVLGAVALVGAAPAASGDGGAKTRVKIKRLKASGASGKVKSGNPRCIAERKVRFFRIEDFISVKVQFDKTNSNGRWKIERDLRPGRYFAKVDSVKGCRYDNSKTERLRQRFAGGRR